MKDAPPQTPIPTPPDGSPPDDTLTPHDGTPPRIAPPRGPPPPWKEAPGISAHRPAMREKEDKQGQPRTTSEARGKICSCTNPRKGEKGPKQGAKHGTPGNRGYYSLGKPGAPPQRREEDGGRSPRPKAHRRKGTPGALSCPRHCLRGNAPFPVRESEKWRSTARKATPSWMEGDYIRRSVSHWPPNLPSSPSLP